MKLDDLTAQEKIVFGCLVRMMIRSDKEFTDAEEEQVNKIGEELASAGAMWKVVSDSAQAYPFENKIRSEVGSVTRPETRELILTSLGKIAGSDGMDARESDLLSWLRSEWS